MYLELRAYGIAKKFGKVTYLGKKVPKARAISVVQGPYSLEPNSGTLLMADSVALGSQVVTGCHMQLWGPSSYHIYSIFTHPHS